MNVVLFLEEEYPNNEIMFLAKNDYRKNQIPNRMGAYILLDKDDYPLYVGCSNDLQFRVNVHMSGHSKNTKDHITSVHSILVIFTEGFSSHQKLETELLTIMNPPLNINRNITNYLLPMKRHLAKRCLGKRYDGGRCYSDAYENGYCKRHGGEGRTIDKIARDKLKEIYGQYIWS